MTDIYPIEAEDLSKNWEAFISNLENLDDERLKNLYRFAMLVSSNVDFLKQSLVDRGAAVPVVSSQKEEKPTLSVLDTITFINKLLDVTGCSVGGFADKCSNHIGWPVSFSARIIETMLDNWAPNGKNIAIENVTPQMINSVFKFLQQITEASGYNIELCLVEPKSTLESDYKVIKGSI